MPHIHDHAHSMPDKIAMVAPDGQALSWKMLNNASIAFANALNSRGIQPGRVVSLMMENRAEYMVVMWAALRLGLYVTPINWHLKFDEVAHIVEDSDSVLLISSAMHRQLSAKMALPFVDIDEPAMRDLFDSALASEAHIVPEFEQKEGQIMYYSSGTTGKPKGIRRPMVERQFGTPPAVDAFISASYGIDDNTVYLSPAPMYHAAPLNWCLAILRLGGSLITLKKFEPESFLANIERYGVTHTQLVPTMFVRLLSLPDDIRLKYDLSSLKVAVHAAAPCAPEIKHQMLNWWGMIIHEYYGGSESNGVTALGPQEWIDHPGSVGKVVLGNLHICDEQGNELGPNKTGTVYFSGLPDFEYYKDPVKTREAYNERGYSTLGDIGYIDDDGFLYLTDRRAFMIVSGGVNIYPQEIENLLISHPGIADVAVLGLPNPEFGEEVVAVIEPLGAVDSELQFVEEVSAFCRSKLAGFKCPRRIFLQDALPRMPNGKLLKRTIKEQLLAS